MKGGVTLLQLEAFYWVARLRSFSAAAARLRTTQPGISTRVRTLEASVRGQLLKRGRRATTLTPLGHELLSYAARFVELGDAFADAAGMQEGLHGVVRVGAADAVALTWLPALLASLAVRFPRLEVELSVDLSLTLHTRLAAGELDIAFVAGAAQHPGLESARLGRVANHWAASARLGLGRRRITADELAAHPVITYLRGSYLHQVVVKWFRSQRVALPRLHSCNSLATLIELTQAGLGVSVLPADMIRVQIAARRLELLDTACGVPSTDFFAVYPDERRSVLVQELASMAGEAAARDVVFGVVDTMAGPKLQQGAHRGSE
jgi:DNA-binding transcriptional LysR family regulator